LAQTIIGNAGANVLSDGGGAGADTLSGFLGNDIYIVRNGSTTIDEIAGRGTNDRVAAGVDFTLATDDNIELLTTTSSGGTAGIDLIGNALAQTIVGNAGDNRIDGKEGNDILNGLGGADTFAFTTALGASNVDTINGFNSADDQIELDGDVFAANSALAAGGSGPLAASRFRANTTGEAEDVNDYIIYDTDDGRLYFDADGDGAGAAIEFAQLTGAPTIAFNDFEVI